MAMLLMASCASKKTITDGTKLPSLPHTQTEKSAEKQSLQFVQRIADNNATTANILASGDFTLKTGSKEITVPAKLSMRKDECIRIQLLMPILRSELARIEFTPDYVLLIDRYHKEDIKASYSEVSFLANNGISFYSLQSLFWNQLTAPGAKHLSAADLKKFAADITATGSRVPVSLSSGNMTFKWSVDAATALIKNADISYRSAAHGTSSLAWSYDVFKTVGAATAGCRRRRKEVPDDAAVRLQHQLRRQEPCSAGDAADVCTEDQRRLGRQDRGVVEVSQGGGRRTAPQDNIAAVSAA